MTQVTGATVGLVGPLLLLVLWGLGAFALYWVVRLAVRHGVGDADRARGGATGPADAPPP